MFQDKDDVDRAFSNGHLSRDAFEHCEAHGVDSLNTALFDAGFGRGELAGRTGDPFKDDPFFNPWAEGGTFNRK